MGTLRNLGSIKQSVQTLAKTLEREGFYTDIQVYHPGDAGVCYTKLILTAGKDGDAKQFTFVPNYNGKDGEICGANYSWKQAKYEVLEELGIVKKAGTVRRNNKLHVNLDKSVKFAGKHEYSVYRGDKKIARFGGSNEARQYAERLAATDEMLALIKKSSLLIRGLSLGFSFEEDEINSLVDRLDALTGSFNEK